MSEKHLTGEYKIADVKVKIVKPVWVWVGPDGAWVLDENLDPTDFGPNHRRVQVTDWHSDGSPVLPS